jgi:GT2 family glycosyltransferase
MGTNPEVERMMGQSVCAVIVTYHPTPKMLENVPEILAQVQRLIVVDNGSTSDELEPVRVMSQSFGFQLIENGENLGIAEALNQGVRWARNSGYPWVILFDQDVCRLEIASGSREGGFDSPQIRGPSNRHRASGAAR